MNAQQGLTIIRERLVEREARPETLQLVDTMIKRASVPGADKAQATLSQLVRLLARSPAANNNIGIYDDLVQLQDELEANANRRVAEAEAEAAKPVPKSKKYYKQLKEREKTAG